LNETEEKLDEVS